MQNVTPFPIKTTITKQQTEKEKPNQPQSFSYIKMSDENDALCKTIIFLINEKKQVYIMDFGCIENVKEELLHNLKLLLKSLIDDDEDMFYLIMEEIGVLTDNIKDDKALQHMYKKMKDLLLPMITDEIFLFDEEWYEKVSSYDNESQSWTLPPNLVHFSKIPFGLFTLFVKMKANVNLCERIKKILDF